MVSSRERLARQEALIRAGRVRSRRRLCTPRHSEARQGRLCDLAIVSLSYTLFTIPQLKIMQEIITLSVFVPFAIFYLKEPLKLDYLWAGLCLCGAACFMFRGMATAS